MSFVHLHRHSDWSLLDGVGTNERYAERAKHLGQSHLAITDHGTMSGVLYHIQACETHGVKPIVGMEAYFRPDAKWSLENKDREYTHLVLLAKNKEGFQNLLKLTSEAYDEDHFYYKPCVDWNLLEKYHEGLIASSSCVSGLLPRLLLKGESKAADDTLKKYLELFKDDFYLEIQPHDFDEQRMINDYLVNLAQIKGVPLVAAIDAHYPYEDWNDTQDIMLMISTNSSFAKRKKSDEEGKEDYLKFSGESFWLMSEQETEDVFDSFHPGIEENVIKEAIKNTQLFADRCEEYEISKDQKVPHVTRSPLEAETIVRGWVKEGLKRIDKEDDQEYLDRIEMELRVIRKNKVMDYFVIVGRGVRWAKDNGVRVGPGRGSAAGSLVSYLCRITGLDPIGYDLLFERFMNEYRTELPDIDLDFQHTRRDEVKGFYRKEFGEDHVVDVCAFQTFGPKASLQSAARVFDVPYADFMHVTKTIQEHVSSTKDLEDLRTDGEHVDLAQFAIDWPEVWKHATRLEGQVKALSQHPAAIIVTDKPAVEYIPTMRGNKSVTPGSEERLKITQWGERADFQVISSYGFLKIDVLSTDSLTIQDTAVKSIEVRTGRKIDFEDIEQFPVNGDPMLADPKVIEMFSHRSKLGLGVFQFTSHGITKLLKDVAGDTGLVMDDIIACNTLYRPGTLAGGIHDEYAERKNGKPWDLFHPDVEPFMGRSYGLMIYQEQVMQVCQTLGGFDKGTSNMVLKALTKWHGSRGTKQKGATKIQVYEKEFIDGCKTKGLTDKQAKSIWEQIMNLTKYVFNRSHSAGYALQAYQDAWLKLYYPLDFYASLLTWETDKVPGVIAEARKRGISILPPDINESGSGFMISGNSIRFGLEAIKGVGQRALEEIAKHKPYASIEDFQAKVEKKKCNSRVVNALSAAGAFDFCGARDNLTIKEKGDMELQLIGFVLSKKSEAEQFKSVLDGYAPPPEKIAALEDGAEVVVAGEILEPVEPRNDKRGNPYGRFELSWDGVGYQMLVFSPLFEQNEHLFGYGNAIVVAGRWDASSETVIAEQIATAAQIEEAEKLAGR